MPGLYLHTSNRLELLAACLASALGPPLADPFASETVVVQSVGMGRWLSLRLAEAHGICANVAFPFPQRFVSDIFQQSLPERAAARFYARENLTWRIMKLLPGLLAQPAFADLRRYLEQPRPELRRFQLAAKIAQLFRPISRLPAAHDSRLGTQEGESDWQPVLWRELIRSAPGLHPPALAEEFIAALRRGAAPLPERVSRFWHFDAAAVLHCNFSRNSLSAIEVHLFMMRPDAGMVGRYPVRARRVARPAPRAGERATRSAI